MEEVFVRFAPIVHLHVRDRVIRTTAEHPFHVLDKGWVPAGELQPGDQLVGHDGQLVAVGEVFATGEFEQVYNFRVADHHTYFVGGNEWGFSVWAHNTTYASGNKISAAEALEHGLTERDANWPWRGLHEAENHHPLMQGAIYRPFWKARGLSDADVEGWTELMDMDIHGAISTAPKGNLPWWDNQLLSMIAHQEVKQSGKRLTRSEVIRTAQDLLTHVKAWSP